jgi:nucleotide-binding universal stress UspA family protein
MRAMKRILVPIDFEDASDAALVYGRNLAKAFGAELHVQVVRTARCPVMTVHQPEHEFVVPDRTEARPDRA